MDQAHADELLRTARGLEWTYPSSSGNPRPDGRYDGLVASRADFAAAAAYFMAHHEPERSMEVAAGSWRLWMKARDVRGGRAFLAAVLDGAGAELTAARAMALYGDGLFAFWTGQVEESRMRNRTALAAAQHTKDAGALTLAYTGLSRAWIQEDAVRAGAMAQLAREHARGLGAAMDQAPLHLLAQAWRAQGDLERARLLFTESVALNRKIGDAGMVAVDLHNLGWVEIHRGDVDAAARHFAACACKDPSHDPYGAALTQLNDAAVAMARGNDREARKLLSNAEDTLHANKLELDADERRELDWMKSRPPTR